MAFFGRKFSHYKKTLTTVIYLTADEIRSNDKMQTAVTKTMRLGIDIRISFYAVKIGMSIFILESSL
jgi:hypothetical protein